MNQRLLLYRKHTPICIHGYTKALYEGDNTLPDCTCPINARGNLENESSRINNRSVDAREWNAARRTRDLWLTWKQTTEPANPLMATKKNAITIEDGCRFFVEFGRSTNTKGNSTDDKYTVLIESRLKLYCAPRGIRFVKEFDDPVTVKQFFMSWKNLQPTRNKKNVPVDLNVNLAPTTTKAELERFRSLLRFWHSNGWITANYALPPHIKLGKIIIKKKLAWTKIEYGQIMKTLETWTDEYGRIGTEKAKMQHAFGRCLRLAGQRISDNSMLGPDNLVTDADEDGNPLHFLELTQIKTGQQVKVPIQKEFFEFLKALPLRGELSEPFVYHSNNRTIEYGTKFWFWTGHSDVEGNAKAWGDDMARVLKRCQEQFGKFKHHSTPHTFRHYFAITMLANGAPIEDVSRWLGHSSVEITKRHYGNANSDFHQHSHSVYMKAMSKIDGQPKPGPTIVRKVRRLKTA